MLPWVKAFHPITVDGKPYGVALLREEPHITSTEGSSFQILQGPEPHVEIGSFYLSLNDRGVPRVTLFDVEHESPEAKAVVQRVGEEWLKRGGHRLRRDSPT